jgi:biotin synthase-related radical SAM superfamily protein
MTTLYGKSATERLVEEKIRSREIVKEILDFGVTQRQLYQLIKLLAENLESYRHMQLITWLIDELEVSDIGDIVGLKEQALQRMLDMSGGTHEGT